MSQLGFPRVTIGMPVYNGEKTIASAIESSLAQTFEDFELVVCDNASSDGTVGIVDRYIAKDRRVRLLRNRTNVGANRNYSAVAREARGEYFKWASANDWCAPTFLEKCVAVLDTHPEVVLAYPKTRLHKGSLMESEDYEDGLDLHSDSRSTRLSQVIFHLRLNNVMNGLIRVSALRQTDLIPDHFSADVILIGHLALLGKFVEIPEYLFYRRMDSESATRLRPTEEATAHFYPNRSAKVLFQNWRIHVGWFRVTLKARIPPADKVLIAARLMRNLYWGWRDLASDIGEARRYLFR